MNKLDSIKKITSSDSFQEQLQTLTPTFMEEHKHKKQF